MFACVAVQYCPGWCSLTADPTSSTLAGSSLVRDVDGSRPVDVQRHVTSPQTQSQQQQVPVQRTTHVVQTSLSTLPMPDVVRESFVEDLPASISPAAQTSVHPALVVIFSALFHEMLFYGYVTYVGYVVVVAAMSDTVQ